LITSKKGCQNREERLMTTQKNIVFFKEIDKHDIPMVGGKTANLGEMTRAGFPVPPGFATTVHAYDKFLKENDLVDWIASQLKNLDVNDTTKLKRTAKNIRRKIERSRVPKDVATDVFKAYSKLSGRFKHILVAVRSSATAEDLPDASFAGQQATFLNIKGEANLLIALRACWASLYTARAIFYREQNEISHKQVKISTIVQKMIQSEVSGVAFTIDPVTNEKDRIVIEAVLGLGELIVQGSVVPDRYTVQKDTFSILAKEISDQSVQLVKKGSKTLETEVSAKLREKQKLSDEEIVKLARISDKLQKHYYFPQDIEWAREKNELFIVQTRPVTTIKSKRIRSSDEIKTAETPILEGSAASPGIGTGVVKILRSPKELDKVKSGDVLVAEMTSPDFVPAMKKAAAIVTNKGGQTSHAAIVSRELGIPCVVGTKEATQKLKDDTIVTVDGGQGLVYLGSKIKSYASKTPKKKEKIIKRKSATKLYVNLAEVELAKKTSKLNVDGVGLLRAEFMIAGIGMHPKEAIKNKKQDIFVKKLQKDLSKFCKSFYPRPVVYRATDFKTNEYRDLPGGKTWEPEEPNPMLGFRGAYRYIAHPDVFNLELTAIKNVRSNYNNLWMMIPYVRSPDELARVRKIVATEGLFEESTFKFWMMVEIPINVILIEDFIKVGIDGVSIGSNDLTMLTIGTDRDNEEVAETFDERSKAVSWSLKRVVRACNKHNVTSSICGQAPSVYDDLVTELVKYGITSISVNPDAINRARGVILEAEKQVASDK
jgi:pyruvate,water dikinase